MTSPYLKLLLVGLIAGKLLAQDPKPSGPKQAASIKHPVPDELTQAKKLAIITQIYRPGYEQATTQEQRVILAEKLLNDAKDTKDDLAARYVLFRVARDMAAQQGNLSMAFKAIEELEMTFDLDHLNLKREVVISTGKTLRNARYSSENVEVLLRLLDELESLDRYDEAMTIAEEAMKCAQAAKSSNDMKKIHVQVMKLREISSEFEKLGQIRQILENNPLDPLANMKVGQFLCLRKGDWPQGLSHLAIGEDGDLKRAANIELDPSSDKVKIADSWWEISNRLEDAEKLAARAHAVEIYRRVLPDLSGLTKIRIERLLEQYSESVPAATKTSAKADVKKSEVGLERTPNWEMLIRDIDTFKTHWKNGDKRGNYQYLEAENVILVDSVWELGSISSGSAWDEIYFELSVLQLGNGRLDIDINGITLKIGHIARQYPNGVPVRIMYSKQKSTVVAVVGRVNASQATVIDKDWNKKMKCAFSTASGHAKMRIANIRFHRPTDSDFD